MAKSLGWPHGTPMDLHCYCSIGAAWKCLMCNTFGIPHVASMGLDGDDHWGFHGMALWAMHWDPMDLHWGCSLRSPWQCSKGRSLGCPHGLPWHCIATAP